LCDSHETDRHPPDVVFYAKKTAIGTPAAGYQQSEFEKQRFFGRYLDCRDSGTALAPRLNP
jgi:hypothetical protein